MKMLFISLALITSNCLFSMAQSIDSEKFEWTWQQHPLIKLSTPMKTYSSVSGYLEIKGLTRQNDADLIVSGGVLPAVAIQSPEITSMDGTVIPGYSQVYWVEAKTKDQKTIYYRVFNEFKELGNAQTIVPGQPIKSEMFYFSNLGKQVSYIFTDFKNTNDFKLFYIKKSTVHDDINQACALARNAVRMMAADSVAPANQQLEQAVSLWSEALKQSNPEDKNARINKKVTEALYKDLIPSLIMLNRFDEAQALIKKSESELGVFYSIFTGMQKYFMTKKRLSYMATTSSPKITLNDIDLPENVNLITSASRLNAPVDLTMVQKILPGSWRTVSVHTKMPASDETYIKSNDPKNSNWHFLPDGKVYLEEEETNPSLNLKLDENYWQVKKSTNGKLFFAIASSPEDLKSTGRYSDFKPFEILHLTLNTMLIKFENNNPNVDVSFYYYQLQRVNLLVE